MGRGHGSDVAGTEGERGHVLGGSAELGEDIGRGDGEDLGVVDRALVEEALDVHLVLEGSDLQFVEEGGLAGGNLLFSGDDSDFIHDFDLRLHNLGLDVQSLEESSLLRVKTGGAGGNDNISGGELADSGGGLSHLGVKDLTDFAEVAVGENESGVEGALSPDLVKLGSFVSLLLEVNDGLADEGLQELKGSVSRFCP